MDLPYPDVVIATCSGGDNDTMFTSCLASWFLYDKQWGHLCINGFIGLISSPRLAATRNKMVRDFLALEVAGEHPMWLLMVDSDMVGSNDIVHRLLAYADPVEVPVLSGLCFAGRPEGCWSTPSLLGVDSEGNWDRTVTPVPYDELPEDALVRIGSVGAACLLIHRGVLLKMAQRFGLRADGSLNQTPWFEDYGGDFGEDVSFCVKLMAMGIPLYVHTGIEFGHRKKFTVDHQWWEANELVDPRDPARRGRRFLETQEVS